MKNNGFTLIELLIVIAIVAILAGAMVPMIRTTRDEAKVARVFKDFEVIKTACHLMHLDTGTWPDLIWGVGGGGFDASGKGIMLNKDFYNKLIPGWNGPYLDAWKNDPWGTPYILFYCFGINSSYLYVVSRGPNGQLDVPYGCNVNGATFSGDEIASLIVKAPPS